MRFKPGDKVILVNAVNSVDGRLICKMHSFEYMVTGSEFTIDKADNVSVELVGHKGTWLASRFVLKEKPPAFESFFD